MNSQVLSNDRVPILDEVSTILIERAEMYGAPEDSFQRIGLMWSAYLGISIEAKDVAAMMCLLKIARETFQHKRDNWIDIIGYAVHGCSMSSGLTEGIDNAADHVNTNGI